MKMEIQIGIDYEALEKKIQDALKDMSVPVSVRLVTKREVFLDEMNVPVSTMPRHDFVKPKKVSS